MLFFEWNFSIVKNRCDWEVGDMYPTIWRENCVSNCVSNYVSNNMEGRLPPEEGRRDPGPRHVPLMQYTHCRRLMQYTQCPSDAILCNIHNAADAIQCNIHNAAIERNLPHDAKLR